MYNVNNACLCEWMQLCVIYYTQATRVSAGGTDMPRLNLPLNQQPTYAHTQALLSNEFTQG